MVGRPTTDVRLPVHDFLAEFHPRAAPLLHFFLGRHAVSSLDVAHSLPQPAIWQDVYGRHGKKEGKSEKEEEGEKEKGGTPLAI